MGSLYRLNNAVKKLGYRDYQNYLLSDHWKQVKDQYFQSGLPQMCKCCHKQLFQLHHLTYERLGCEKLEDVAPLCKICHRKIHRIHRTHDIPLSDIDRAIEITRQDLPVGQIKLDQLSVEKFRKQCSEIEICVVRSKRKKPLSDTRLKLLKICLLLSEHQDTFFLSSITAAQLMDVSQSTALKHLNRLVEQSYLRMLELGDVKTKKASVYCFEYPPMFTFSTSNSSEFHLDTK